MNNANVTIQVFNRIQLQSNWMQFFCLDFVKHLKTFFHHENSHTAQQAWRFDLNSFYSHWLPFVWAREKGVAFAGHGKTKEKPFKPITYANEFT